MRDPQGGSKRKFIFNQQSSTNLFFSTKCRSERILGIYVIVRPWVKKVRDSTPERKMFPKAGMFGSGMERRFKTDFSKAQTGVDTKHFWTWMLHKAWFVGLVWSIWFFLLLVLTIKPSIVHIKSVLFYKTPGISSWLCYLLSCQSHEILLLHIRDNAFFLHSSACFLYLECRKTECLSHKGQKGTTAVEKQ